LVAVAAAAVVVAAAVADLLHPSRPKFFHSLVSLPWPFWLGVVASVPLELLRMKPVAREQTSLVFPFKLISPNWFFRLEKP
jgi:hypothetical protein